MVRAALVTTKVTGKPQFYVAKIEGAERRIDVIEFLALAEAIGVDAAAGQTRHRFLLDAGTSVSL